MTLDKESLGWDTRKGFHLKTSTARSGEQGWWRGNGSRIQQLVFAGKEKEASSWLAVRYQGAISIFKPVFQKKMVCPSNANGPIQDLPPSQLDANHISTVLSSDADGLPFADVSFDPRNPHHFVTVDQGGRWQTWILKTVARFQNVWAPVKGSSGSITNGENENPDNPRPTLDGWARALWVGGAETLLVAKSIDFGSP